MGNPMKIRAKTDGRVTEVKVLMSHVMETGQRKNPQGEPIPAHFIQFVTIAWQDRTVLRAQWGPALSANPFLSFKFDGGQKGDKLKVSWVDNKGDTRSDEVTIS
jgi:sulfur-oxidizing protein SoxZ